jgi:hypothetical protein
MTSKEAGMNPARFIEEEGTVKSFMKTGEASMKPQKTGRKAEDQRSGKRNA